MLEAQRIDREQQVAAMHQLVIVDIDLGHQAGDVRRQIDDVGTHAAIARPRRVFVVVP